MANDIDRPDDSTARRHRNSVAEETSATGQRVKGAIKDVGPIGPPPWHHSRGAGNALGLTGGHAHADASA